MSNKMITVSNSYSFVPLMKKFHTYKYEIFLIVAMNNRKEVIATKVISGGTSEVNIDYKEILSFLKEKKATYFVLLHNHPSGNVIPSATDCEATFGYYMFFKSMEITLIDHIVFSQGNYFSFFNSYVLDEYKKIYNSGIWKTQDIKKNLYKVEDKNIDKFYNRMFNNY